MPSKFMQAATKVALQFDSRCSDGYWAVLYQDDGFGGKTLIIRDAQQDSMPSGWDDEATSAIVGPGAVLRLFHGKNYQSAHITLLPGEEVSNLKTVGIHDAGSSYKLWRTSDLQPPY